MTSWEKQGGERKKKEKEIQPLHFSADPEGMCVIFWYDLITDNLIHLKNMIERQGKKGGTEGRVGQKEKEKS